MDEENNSKFFDNVDNMGVLVFPPSSLSASQKPSLYFGGEGLKFVNLGFNPNLTCFTGFHRKFSPMLALCGGREGNSWFE